MKVFVTGGTGFVGAHLVRALLERGDAVRCLVRDPAKAAALGWTGAVELVRGDLNDARALRDGCAGAEVVYHVAGRVSARNAPEFMAANRDGTARVLEAAAAEPPRRFLYVSSLAAAGPAPRGQPIDESRPPAPVTPYGRSKLSAELLVRAAPVPWTIVRPPMVYGERDRELFKLFKLARAAVVPVFGDGSQELSVIYAADLADAVIAAATAQRSAGMVYFAAHPSVTTSRELVRAIGRAVGSN
ncbi:MAG TPA: NAD(P)-dependent oxidoreductase, partial [Gemmatimonadales bacterium]